MSTTLRMFCLFTVSAFFVPASAAPRAPLSEKRGSDVSRQGTAQLMLLPVGGNGNEITINPGDTVEIELFISDVSDVGSGLPKLRGYAAYVTDPAEGGFGGSVTHQGNIALDCNPETECSPYVNFFSREDFVFYFIPTSGSAGLDPPRIARAVNDSNTSVSVTDAKYAGRFLYAASSDAVGDFTVQFTGPNTALADPDQQDIPFQATPAIIHIACTGDGDCDDELFCTGVESCSGGVCQPGTNPCTNPDFPFCDEVNDECDECEVDQDCDDSVFCNGAETCPDGVCVPAADLSFGTPCGSGNDTICDGADTCDGAGACQDNHASNGTSCADDEYCDGDEICTNGQCTDVAPVDCDDGLTCTADSCNEIMEICDNDLIGGNCLIANVCQTQGTINPANECEECNSGMATDDWSPRQEGTSCDDGLFCNVDEACASGICSGGVDRDCSDQLTCTTDSCDEDADTCVSVLDPDRCLIGGECFDPAAINPDNECQECNPDLATGDWSARSNGTACDDGLFCNENESCMGGVCGGGSFTCDDDNTCTIDSCDEQQQVCSNDVDPNSCLIDEACVANGVLNPLNSCEVCDSAQSPDTWSVLPDDSACEEDAFICTADLCAAGACTHDNLIEGTECDADGEPCNGVDTCDGMGSCLPGAITDCNENGVDDACDIDDGTSLDCNENQVPDSCDIALGTSDDCNGNDVPDDCEPDCNENGVADECDIADQTSPDCNVNGVPDECEGDCNENGIPDDCDITDQTSPDCNDNQVPDECDFIFNLSQDCNNNDVPDECDIADQTSPDCNTNDVPDECDIADQTSPDCDANGTPDECDMADCPQGDLSCADCQPNGIPDGCDIADGTSLDVNPTNGLPDECEACESNQACDDGDWCTFDWCVDDACQNIDAPYGDTHGPGGTCGPDGTVSLLDILGTLDGFSGFFHEGCELSNIDISGDLGGCEPNGVIDLRDILAVLDAFTGLDECGCDG